MSSLEPVLAQDPTAVPDARPLIGWREWVALPELGIPTVKVKVDTGARTSALHAVEAHPFRRRGRRMIRFKVQPLQRNRAFIVEAEAEFLGNRRVRDSGGHVEIRPLIRTAVELQGRRWTIEMTLASRDEMGFRMLLGRQALKERFCVDPGRSFLAGRSRAERHRKRKKDP